MPDPTPGPDPDPAPTGLTRLRRSLLRPSRGQAVVAVLVGLLAFAAVTQVRISSHDDTYAGLRQDQLVQALDGLQAASRKSERDIADLQQTRDQLTSSTRRRAAALAQAQKELATLSVLAGTTAATGPGIQVTIQDPRGGFSLTHLLDGVEELRNAGVEAIQINDRVRVIAQTYFEDDPQGIVVDGTLLKAPYVLDAIGSPDTLAGALNFQGGFVDDVKLDGGSVTIKKEDKVSVTVTRTPSQPRYAVPVPGQ